MSARSKRKPPNMDVTQIQIPVPKKPRKISAIGTITWGANSSALIYQLLCEVEKPENFKVLFGKKDKHEVSWPLFLCAILTYWFACRIPLVNQRSAFTNGLGLFCCPICMPWNQLLWQIGLKRKWKGMPAIHS
jgi:hypothetical protein